MRVRVRACVQRTACSEEAIQRSSAHDSQRSALYRSGEGEGSLYIILVQILRRQQVDSRKGKHRRESHCTVIDRAVSRGDGNTCQGLCGKAGASGRRRDGRRTRTPPTTSRMRVWACYAPAYASPTACVSDTPWLAKAMNRSRFQTRMAGF